MKKFICNSLIIALLVVPMLSHAEWVEPMKIDKVQVDIFGNVQVHIAPSPICPKIPASCILHPALTNNAFFYS